MDLIPVPKPVLWLTATALGAMALRARKLDADKVDPGADINGALIYYSQHDLYICPTEATRADFAQLAGRLVSLGNTVYIAPVDADLAALEPSECRRVEQPLSATERRVKSPPKGSASDTTRERWRELGLHLGPNGQPVPNIDNALRAMTASALPIWWDEFLQRAMTEWNCTPREFRDTDYVDLTVWMQRELEIRTISLRTVTSAADAYIRTRIENCAQAWIGGLSWDLISRLDYLGSEGFGTPQDEYHSAVLRCFIMGLCKRILDPGCQVDSVPVFEGPEGISKSTALRIIGGKWFAECHEEVTGKDFLQIMPGKMLLEVAELHSFRRADVERIKGIISNRVDRYRASYGRSAADHPRMCVFAGTTNRDDWNNSDTGARRFWPVRCGAIDLQWIATNREQLFAEAACRLSEGEPHWNVPADAAAAHVDARRVGDAWEGLITRYCEARATVEIEAIMRDCLEIKKDRATNADAVRIRSVLRTMGWKMKSTTRNSRSCWLWFAPSNADRRVENAPPEPSQATIPLIPETNDNPFDPSTPF